MTTEVRLDRMRPAEVEAALARASVAWVPMGAIEFHAPHLPLGTDSITASHLVIRAAEELGGVVLPPSPVTMGTLHLPWSVRYAAGLVEAVLRSTIEQLAASGVRVVVVHTGHAPLDLLHLIKRVCREVESQVRAADPSRDGFRAYGLCYLELNAALGAGLGTDWPVVVDHGSVTETSWVLAIEPTLVDLAALPPEGAGPIVGVYGPHPSGRASGAYGSTQIDACLLLLTERVRALTAGGTIDGLADLRTLVERYWPESMEISVVDRSTLGLRNPGPVSRYLTGLRVVLDGVALDGTGQRLVNTTTGEAGVAVPVDCLGAESGFYVRRHQTAWLLLREPLSPGEHQLAVELGFAGVSSAVLQMSIDVP